jgi:predicted acyl esterase
VINLHNLTKFPYLRDGVKLEADVYRPARADRAVDGKFPVILERTPYGKARSSRSEVDRGETKPRWRQWSSTVVDSRTRINRPFVVAAHSR